jgi:hypothetical protein
MTKNSLKIIKCPKCLGLMWVFENNKVKNCADAKELVKYLKERKTILFQ